MISITYIYTLFKVTACPESYLIFLAPSSHFMVHYYNVVEIYWLIKTNINNKMAFTNKDAQFLVPHDHSFIHSKCFVVKSLDLLDFEFFQHGLSSFPSYNCTVSVQTLCSSILFFSATSLQLCIKCPSF